MNQQFPIQQLSTLIELSHQKNKSADKIDNVCSFEFAMNKQYDSSRICNFNEMSSTKTRKSHSSRSQIMLKKPKEGQNYFKKTKTIQNPNPSLQKETFIDKEIFTQRFICIQKERTSVYSNNQCSSRTEQKKLNQNNKFRIPGLLIQGKIKYKQISSRELKIKEGYQIFSSKKIPLLSEDGAKLFSNKTIPISVKNNILKNDRKETELLNQKANPLQIKSLINITDNQNKSKNIKIPAFIKSKGKQINGNAQNPTINIDKTLNTGSESHCSSRKISKANFIIGSLIGKGTFSHAYIAVERNIGFICVLKILQKPKIKQRKSQTNLLRQIKIQSFLSHSHLTNLYGIFDDEQRVYLIMELIPGGNLRQIIKKEYISQIRASKIILQVCLGINHLHTASIIHRDIKPQNIFIYNDYVKIGDFGCSVYSKVKRSSFIGTPCYKSPEQFNRDQYDQKTDIWEIGTIFYELLFKICPFYKEISQMHQKKQYSKLLSELKFPSNYRISSQAQDLINQTLDKCPQTRLNIKQVLNHQLFQKHTK